VAFRFSLESVLKHRKRQEDVAHREFVEAQVVVEECFKRIDTMYRQIDATRTEIAVMVKVGKPSDLHFVRSSETFIEAQKIRIHKERMRARELIRMMEEKETILLQCLADRKTMDKLKEKRLEEYKARLALLEQKELDDLTNARWARGR
jgi:flagellar FliJ protein